MCVHAALHVQIASMKFFARYQIYTEPIERIAVEIHLYSVRISKSSTGLEIPALAYLLQLPCSNTPSTKSVGTINTDV